MNLKKRRLLSLLICAVLMFGAISMPTASAENSPTEEGEWVYSEYKTNTVYGSTYKYRSSINAYSLYKLASSSSLYASTVGSKFATGHIGCNARIYSMDGALVGEGGWVFNSSSTVTGVSSPWLRLISSSVITTKYYFAQAQVKLYDGTGYVDDSTYMTPYVKASSAFSSAASVPSTSFASASVTEALTTRLPLLEYGVNKYGQTYGSALYSGEDGEAPLLIKAIGINGVEGYVYESDLDHGPDTLEEALVYIDEGPSSYTIPLYAVDGVTVVDSFQVGS